MNEALQHFKSVCEKEFNYLIEEYGFRSSPLPSGKFVNEFQFRLTNEVLTLVVEGISYGMDAMISIQDNFGRSVSIGSLLPGWEPFAKRKRVKKKHQLNQDQQIAQAAKQLKEHGQDVLGGNLERFNNIGDRINNIMSRFKDQRNNQQSH